MMTAPKYPRLSAVSNDIGSNTLVMERNNQIPLGQRRLGMGKQTIDTNQNYQFDLDIDITQDDHEP